MREHTWLDEQLIQFDRRLKNWLPAPPEAARSYPAQSVDGKPLTETERRHSAGLMRVNHAGEVCAQALYESQAHTARSDDTVQRMKTAAAEEVDHLAWCERRLSELNSHTSYLNPAWYLGAYLIGLMAGLLGDRWSLGFVAETEHQVVAHLQRHLEQLASIDPKSHAIIKQMQMDENEHALTAQAAGGSPLPPVIQTLMQLLSKAMTRAAYFV